MKKLIAALVICASCAHPPQTASGLRAKEAKKWSRNNLTNTKGWTLWSGLLVGSMLYFNMVGHGDKN